MVIRPLTVASLLLALAACATTIRNDPGGRVIEYAVKAHKPSFVRFDGKCMSACTLYLSNRNTCITRRASFHFHHPYGGTPAQNAIAAQFMMNSYPLWVREWLIERGGLTPEWLVIDYGTARKFMTLC